MSSSSMQKITLFIRRKQKGLVKDVISAAVEGLDSLNVKYNVLYEDEYEPCDIAILYGLYKNISGIGSSRKEIYDTQSKNNKKILVFERGYLKRDMYHSAGWDWVNGRANFKNINSPADRFSELNIDLKRWGSRGDNIIICGQVPWDSAVQHLNLGTKGKNIKSVDGYLSWIKHTIEEIENRSSKKIIFRPHPLFRRPEWYQNYVPKHIVWSNNNLHQDLEKAHACVVFNSNCAVEAAIEGIPIFVSDSGSMVYDIANTSLKKINKPKKVKTSSWAYDLAYAQWSIDEIKNGYFWKHLNKTNE